MYITLGSFLDIVTLYMPLMQHHLLFSYRTMRLLCCYSNIRRNVKHWDDYTNTQMLALAHFQDQSSFRLVLTISRCKVRCELAQMDTLILCLRALGLYACVYST